MLRPTNPHKHRSHCPSPGRPLTDPPYNPTVCGAGIEMRTLDRETGTWNLKEETRTDSARISNKKPKMSGMGMGEVRRVEPQD